MSLGEPKSPDEKVDEKGDRAGSHEKSSRRKKAVDLKARVEELEAALEMANSKAEENHERWLRSRAEYENLKKRTSREIQQIHQRAGQDLVASLLPVLDDLEKAIEASRESAELKVMEEGLSLIHRGLLDALAAAGVQILHPEGQKFDPNVHEAILQMPSKESRPGTVVQVLQNGYLMNGVTLRAAKVVVAGHAQDAQDEMGDSDDETSSWNDESSEGEDALESDDEEV